MSVATSVPEARPSTGLNVALWIVQVLVALAFLGAAGLKLGTPYEELAKQMQWVAQANPAVVKLIAVVEVAGALGLLLPSLLRILPWLTPVAAVGLVLDMGGAAVTHAKLGEPQMIVGNVVLGALAAFVAWGRFRKAPIAAR